MKLIKLNLFFSYLDLKPCASDSELTHIAVYLEFYSPCGCCDQIAKTIGQGKSAFSSTYCVKEFTRNLLARVKSS